MAGFEAAISELAPAKLNLALHVRGKLTDGRHAIETLFAFCVDGDLVEAEEAEELSLEVVGPFAEDLVADEDNLVLRAARALRSATNTQSGARLVLTKNLPVASGIGGGSADAAATLRLLARLWHLNHDRQARLMDVAADIGADVPACLLSQSCFGVGAGDHIQQIDGSELTGLPVLLVNPGVPLSTRDVFARWDGQDRGAILDWRDGRNDLQSAAIGVIPQIEDVLDFLSARQGARYVRMSGSGATCFALFDNEQARDTAAAACPASWWHLASHLR